MKTKNIKMEDGIEELKSANEIAKSFIDQWWSKNASGSTVPRKRRRKRN